MWANIYPHKKENGAQGQARGISRGNQNPGPIFNREMAPLIDRQIEPIQKRKRKWRPRSSTWHLFQWLRICTDSKRKNKMASKIKHVHGVSFPRFKIRTIVQKLTSIVKHVASSFGLLRCKNAIRFCGLIYPYMGPIVSAQLHSAYCTWFYNCIALEAIIVWVNFLKRKWRPHCQNSYGGFRCI